MAHLDEVAVGHGIRIDRAVRLHRRELQVAAQQVRILLWKQDQIPGGHLDRLGAVGQPHLAAAFGEEMEKQHVLGPGKPRPDARQAESRMHAPRRGELRVQVDGAFKAH